MGRETDKQEERDREAPPEERSAGNGHTAASNGEHAENSAQGQDAVQQDLFEQNLVQEDESQKQQEPPEHEAPEDTGPPGRPRRRWWLRLALAAFLLLIGLVVYHFRTIAERNEAAAKAGRQEGGAAITVATSRTGNINIYVDALGTVTPIATITLFSQITGQVFDVHYKEGQIVEKGDPLIDIDPRPYEATLLQSQGTLEHDQSVLAQARMDLERYRAALERNAIARQQFEDQEKTVVQAEGTVRADQATVLYNQLQLSYCHIVSPITGRVGLRLVDPGNTIFAGTGATLVVITELQPITVVFNVSEDDLNQVRAQVKGGRSLEVDAYDRTFDKKIEAGTLGSLDNQVDTTTGTVKFRAEFPNKNLDLYPNQFVNARLLVKTLRKVTLVPSAAVQQNGTNAFVYVVKPGNVVAVQQVKVLTSDETETAVEGLNSGTQVATSGFDRLENGVAVTIRGERNQQNKTVRKSTAPARRHKKSDP
jgi:membrane fusion protein, multidrug efflux system